MDAAPWDSFALSHLLASLLSCFAHLGPPPVTAQWTTCPGSTPHPSGLGLLFRVLCIALYHLPHFIFSHNPTHPDFTLHIVPVCGISQTPSKLCWLKNVQTQTHTLGPRLRTHRSTAWILINKILLCILKTLSPW